MGIKLQHRIFQTRPLEPQTEAILNVIVCADYLRSASEQICARHGISFVQYNVLRILKGVHPGGHPRCEILKRLLERASDVTRVVDRLERAGLAERVKSFTDRRMSLTRITENGLEVLDAVTPLMTDFSDSVSQKLTVEELKVLSELCEKVYEEN